jgi:dihydroorotate dehydrogenase
VYKTLFKSVLTHLDPEKVHHQTIGLLANGAKIPGYLAVLQLLYGETGDYTALEQKVWDLRFNNPVGLAAGLDKNAEAIPAFSSIGLGFVEVGTLTPRPQSGNDLPRLFRLPEDQAIINRMGFNNSGAEEAAHRMASIQHRPVPVGINIGKNKTTPNEEAANDYRRCLEVLYPYGDYFVVNISSPNTPDLRNLQHGEELARLVSAVQEEAGRQASIVDRKKPVLVKIAPDLTDVELGETVEVLKSLQVSGIIATNTTLERKGLRHANAKETGGLSGKPLTKASTEIIRKIYQLTEGKIPIIGVGGIFNGADAYEKILAGATLVQVYTGLIYEGPAIANKINAELLQLLERDGYNHIGQATGRQA